jgi:hypothetical protein
MAETLDMTISMIESGAQMHISNNNYLLDAEA